MNIVTEINAWQLLRQKLEGQNIGFVPTMGNLHAGHISLCEHARCENQIVIVSIFVNPTQFNQANDFDTYPRTIDRDGKLLKQCGVDYLLLPTAEAMYPDQYQMQVTETLLSHELEGEYRPGHFAGMLTVVLKLLNLVRPNRAYFGEKDYQQFLLIKKMAEAFFLPTDIVPCHTVRDSDQLALSSRNSRLNPEQRAKAAIFPNVLQSDLSTSEIANELTEQGFKVEYVAEKWGRRLAAVWLDEVRLIDNIPIKREVPCFYV